MSAGASTVKSMPLGLIESVQWKKKIKNPTKQNLNKTKQTYEQKTQLPVA